MPDYKEKNILLSELFPQLSEERQREAEENLRKYLAVPRRIFEHVQANNPNILTQLRECARLKKEKAHK